MRRHKMLITVFIAISCFFLGGGESAALQECGNKSFQCGDGSCIPKAHRCDGVKQCQKGKDENNCLEAGYCLPSAFKCHSGSCISDDQVCNGVINCPSGEDEKECGICPTGKFECLNGQCVHGYQVCDGRNDCSTGEDEKGCGQCSAGEFKCPNGNCIQDQQVCDGHIDCSSGEDEKDCVPCRGGAFECLNGKCIYGYQVCDGQSHCSSGEDEYDCRQCSAGEFKCLNDECIHDEEVCDGHSDCPSGEDEKNCAPCIAGEFECLNRKCIHGYQVCDRQFDCSRGEDEVDCHYPTTTIPKSSTIRTDTSTTRSTSSSSFDIGAIANCPDYQFECIDGTCIDKQYVCDGVPDCSQGEDEYCSPSVTGTTPKCFDYQYECSDGECIDKQYLCDGAEDCSQGEDEEGCFTTVTGVTTSISPSTPIPRTTTKCSDQQYECTDGICINKDKVCDGKPDCKKGEDEQDCSTPVTDYPSTTVPRSSPIPMTTTKPPFVIGMMPNCESYEYKCKNGTCIYEKYVCDGFPDCSEGEDEQGCSFPVTGTTTKCLDYEYECSDGKCINKQYLCDGAEDCSQGEDEHGCFTTVTGVTTSISRSTPKPMTTTKPPFISETTSKCSDQQYECTDGECINKDKVCDGKRDCNEGEDEQDCSTTPTGHPTTVDGTTAGCSRNPSLSVSLFICLSICLAFCLSLYMRDGYAD